MPQTNKFRGELSRLLDFLKTYEDNSDYVIDFIDHCRQFCTFTPIEKYPKWSSKLGGIRNRVIDENLNSKIASAINAITKLIHDLEYGAIENKHVNRCKSIQSQLIFYKRDKNRN